MSETFEFLNKAGVFFVTTVDGDKPRVRPFGFKMEYDGKLYFGGGNHKAFYRELKANPECEICACAGPDWVRIRGKVVFDEDNAAAMDHAWEVAPNLKGMYTQEGGPRMALFYFENPSVVWASMTTPETKNLSI